MMNICTKFGFDILIISGSYGGHRQHMMYDRRQTTPQVWHKLTGELNSVFLPRPIDLNGTALMIIPPPERLTSKTFLQLQMAIQGYH